MITNIISETMFGFRYPYDDCQPLVDFVEAFTTVSFRLSCKKSCQLSAVGELSLKSHCSLLQFHTKISPEDSSDERAGEKSAWREYSQGLELISIGMEF